MSKFEKLLERIKNNPKTVRFEEIEKVLLGAGYVCLNAKGSHYTFRKQDKQPITIPRHLPYVGEIYVKKVILELGL